MANNKTTKTPAIAPTPAPSSGRQVEIGAFKHQGTRTNDTNTITNRVPITPAPQPGPKK